MEERRFKTAYTIAKIFETISWIILIVGVIAGIAVGSKLGAEYGFMVAIFGALLGVFCVFSSQLTLIFIETENNTRQSTVEVAKMRMILTDALSTLIANTSKSPKE